MIINQMQQKRVSHSVELLVSALAVACLVLGVTTSAALAFPVQGQFVDNPALCDTHPTQNFGHELGDITLGFPVDEGLAITSVNTPQVTCVGDDGAPNDFLVTISNISPYPYTDLFLVADDGVTIGNADGAVTDLNAPGFTDAFKIDNVGINSNLVFGDLNNNLVIEPGESWQFLITNLVTPAVTPPFPVFGSIGGFAASSQPDSISNLSILANRIPEPSSAMLIAGFGAWLGAGRRRKFKHGCV